MLCSWHKYISTIVFGSSLVLEDNLHVHKWHHCFGLGPVQYSFPSYLQHISGLHSEAWESADGCFSISKNDLLGMITSGQPHLLILLTDLMISPQPWCCERVKVVSGTWAKGLGGQQGRGGGGLVSCPWLELPNTHTNNDTDLWHGENSISWSSPTCAPGYRVLHSAWAREVRWKQ